MGEGGKKSLWDHFIGLFIRQKKILQGTNSTPWGMVLNVSQKGVHGVFPCMWACVVVI